MNDRTLILRCSCGVEHLDIDLRIEEETMEAGHFTFGTWWDQHRTWQERIVAAWTILRGKSHYFDVIDLGPVDLARVYVFLGQALARSGGSHYVFNQSNSSASWTHSG